MSIRRAWVLVLAGVSVVACVACSSGNSAGPSPDSGPSPSDDASGTQGSDGGGTDATQTATQTIGAAGGTVTVPGLAVTVPAGALPADTTITITVGGAQVPPAYVGLSPVFSISPAGTVLLQPATVDFALGGQTAGASVFWSNGAGGFDPLPTKTSADGVSVEIMRFGDGFYGKERAAQDAAADATTATDAAPDAPGVDEAGPDAAVDSGTAIDSGSDASVADSGTATDSGSTDGSTPGDAGAPDGGASSDSGTSDGGSGTEGGAEGGSADAAASDAGLAGITVTIDGTPTSFTHNPRATLLQAWWQIAADDSASGPHWTMQLVVPTNAAGLNCGGAFPSMTYSHYSGVDGGAADTTFTSSTSGASCFIDELTTATVQGQHANGTFSGTLVEPTDAGTPPTHALTSGSYDIIVP
jgi:hypothetical protein